MRHASLYCDVVIGQGGRKEKTELRYSRYSSGDNINDDGDDDDGGDGDDGNSYDERSDHDSDRVAVVDD